MELKQRRYEFDNLKVLLILLVVFGHLINVIYKFQSEMTEVKLVSGLWMTIYTFHMSAFVFISGFFSKNFDKSNRNMFNSLIIPYLIFNTLFYIMRMNFKIPISPDSAMWYLFALIIWRLLLPYLSKIKGIIVWSFLLSFLSCFIDCNVLDIHVIKYLPIFMLGYKCSDEVIDKIKNIPKSISISLLLLLLSVTFLLNILGIYTDDMLYVSSNVLERNLSGLITFIGRVISVAFAIVITALLINVMPSKEYFFTKYGKNTMVVYLIHYLPFVQLAYQKIVFTQNPYVAFIFIVFLTPVIVVVLSQNRLKRIYDFAVNSISGLFIEKRKQNENN